MRLVVVVLALCMAGCPEHGSGGPGGGGQCEGVVCGAGEFCDFGRNGCGNLNADVGTCQPRPNGCDDIFEPVCGCDGRTYSNSCDANAAGVDVDASGACPLQPNQFACGFRACTLVDEFCQHGFSDIGGEPDSFSCQRFPPCPGAQDCMCLANEACGGSCMGDAASGFEVQCLGG